jgi:hypothetical protein
MKPFLIFLVSVLFGAANSIAWHLIGFTDGTSGGPAALRQRSYSLDCTENMERRMNNSNAVFINR